MQSRILIYNQEAREKLKRGIDALANMVGVTLGPKGRNVIIEQHYGSPLVTKDGVTVAQQVFLEDGVENMGAQLLKEVASKTADIAGDGPQPLWSKILTPNGFITMGKAKVNMEICGTAGSVQTIIGIYPKGKKEVYNVCFSDGQIVECCIDHLFTVVTYRGSKKTITVGEMLKDFKKSNKKGYDKYRYYIQNEIPYMNNFDTILDPYLLGVLLGNGSLIGSGFIELSLGLAKEHIISKLVLPEGITANVKYVKDRNYFRVKLIGRTIDGYSMLDILKKLNLNVGSGDKFIPDCYLYNSIDNRQKLLQGLIDTDSYINDRGLIEFSTISEKLAKGFWLLMLSLGKHTKISIHDRTRDVGSYSDKPIYRICGRKGYMYGLKIIDIIPTGKFTEMQCIKVSNPDNLYITDDYIITHNTTTATILAQAIVTEGLKNVTSGANPMDLKRGIDLAVKAVTAALIQISKPVQDKKDIIEIGTISANNDRDIGELVADAIDQVGKEGIITLEDSKGVQTYIDVVEGMQFDRGYLAMHFITDTVAMNVELNNVNVLVIEGRVSRIDELVPVLEKTVQDDASILIIAEDVDSQALKALIVNKLKGKLKVCAVKSPGFGDRRLDIMQDIATLTGGVLISEDSGHGLKSVTVSDLGKASKVVVTKDTTTIIEGSGGYEAISDRISQIKALIDNCESSYDKQRLQERLAKLSGGIAVLRVGAATEAEQKEKKMRVEAALHATRAAIKEGIVPGGGIAFIRAKNIVLKQGVGALIKDQETGVSIVLKAIERPLMLISENAGVNGEVVLNEVCDSDDEVGYGYNALTGEYENLYLAGIIDPTKVTRTALENAASIAGLFLTTEGIIAASPEEKAEVDKMLSEQSKY